MAAEGRRGELKRLLAEIRLARERRAPIACAKSGTPSWSASVALHHQPGQWSASILAVDLRPAGPAESAGPASIPAVDPAQPRLGVPAGPASIPAVGLTQPGETKQEPAALSAASEVSTAAGARSAGFALSLSSEGIAEEEDTSAPEGVAGISAAHPRESGCEGEEGAAQPSSDIKPPPGLEPPLGALPLFVISLDSEEGRARQRRMQLMLIQHRCVVTSGVPLESVPEHVQLHWNYGRMSMARNRALQGAFSAHWKVWMRIAAEGDKGALVLEDNCVQYRLYPELDKYPKDGITLLGGCFKGYNAQGLCERNYIKTYQFLEVLASLQAGLQPLPQRDHDNELIANKPANKRKQLAVIRWSMCVAYVVPPGFASRLNEDVKVCSGRVLTSPDIWLGHYTKYFLWPPAFGDQGCESSRSFTDSHELTTDLYCSSEMRHVAEKAGRPMPALGAPVVDVQNWQIRELLLQRPAGRQSGDKCHAPGC